MYNKWWVEVGGGGWRWEEVGGGGWRWEEVGGGGRTRGNCILEGNNNDEITKIITKLGT